MSAITMKSSIKRSIIKSKDHSSRKTNKKKKKDLTLKSSSFSTSHQQHHSAPPSHHQLSKSGLDAIHENGEYPSAISEQVNLTSTRFPRSSTVPYSGYASIRKSDGNTLPATTQSSQTDDVTSIPGTVSPGQFNSYYTTRQPFTVINTNFQPISPQHQFYGPRPVDILKPTFLLVPKAAEQKLVAQLSASSSPILTNKNKSTMMKKSVQTNEQSPSITRYVNIQNKSQSPTTITTTDTGYRHVGLVATANPSPYVHFVNVTYPKKQNSQEPLPENSEIQPVNEYDPAIHSSIRSMPNISLRQGKKKKELLVFKHMLSLSIMIYSTYQNLHPLR